MQPKRSNSLDDAILGVVLAGGKSTRMGTNKAKLSIHQTSLLNFSANKLVKAGIENVKISGAITCETFENFEDVIGDRGPLGGIYSAMCRFEFDGALFVPVDIPLMTANSLKALVEYGLKQQKACYFADSNLPLYLPYDVKTQQFIKKNLIAGRKLSIQSLIEFTNAESLDCIDAIELTNTNTPQEWAQATQLVS